MSKFFIICFVVVLILCISSADDASKCKCNCKKCCKKDTPMKFIYQIVSHFKEVHSCNRSFVTNKWISEDNVRMISYAAELNENESALDVCSCIYSYLTQKDWLNGATQSCCVRKNIVTMRIEGEPDPTFNEEMDNANSEDPVEQLKNIFDQFPIGEIAKHQCRPSYRTDKSGKIHFEIQCDLCAESPSKEKLCEAILQYLNQDNWLGELASTCTTDGNLLDMEIMDKSELDQMK